MNQPHPTKSGVDEAWKAKTAHGVEQRIIFPACFPLVCREQKVGCSALMCYSPVGCILFEGVPQIYICTYIYTHTNSRAFGFPLKPTQRGTNSAHKKVRSPFVVRSWSYCQCLPKVEWSLRLRWLRVWFPRIPIFLGGRRSRQTESGTWPEEGETER